MRAIPLHRFPQPFHEITLRLPSEFRAGLAVIHRVAEIVARPVGHELDQPTPIPRARDLRHEIAEEADEIDVPPLVTPADQIGFPYPARLRHPSQRPAMILGMDPVPLLPAIAIHWDLLII